MYVKRYSFTSNLLCLILLPFALFGGPAALLCVCEDGRVAIEIGEDGTCSHGASGDHANDPLNDEDSAFQWMVCPEAASDCGDCIDVALQLSEADLRWGGDLSWVPFAALSSGSAPIRFVDSSYDEAPVRFESPPSSASLIFCASVRLRI